ncbi:hypothetical protein DICPUDRAFT_75646 [Dictyostelium purpureum]|uniref:Uncharacterized protein n=1 Tax=Dictyostelium purpureum TaxID=5786 RepID=F0ZB93_DICPU|nr:uncharacterized protein DICPUDRAFT_75646 [Dictyostelium purpureum]EGC38802.1 hypothetical protein DICPUDRAFT_75646 [Dictyostelium purpureum]|eukprot:XP_003284696.1 hypothetical protein DICPUDRAFT_75646 [Dictyostelium purpureum]
MSVTKVVSPANSGDFYRFQNFHKVVVFFGFNYTKYSPENHFLKSIALSKNKNSAEIIEKYCNELNIKPEELRQLQTDVNILHKTIGNQKSIIFSKVDITDKSKYHPLKDILESNEKYRKDKIEKILKFVKEKNINITIPDYVKERIFINVDHDYSLDIKSKTKEEFKNEKGDKEENKPQNEEKY